MQLDRKSLAFGQLPSTKGDLYSPATGNKGLVHNVVFHNTNTSAETVELYYHDGTNEYLVLKQSIDADDTFIWDFRGAGDVIEDGAKLTGNTTTAAKVTYKFSGTEETPSAAVASGGGGAEVLWEWNGTDITQFGNGSGTPDYTHNSPDGTLSVGSNPSTGDTPSDNVLIYTAGSQTSAIAHFIINDLPVMPEKFIVRARLGPRVVADSNPFILLGVQDATHWFGLGWSSSDYLMTAGGNNNAGQFTAGTFREISSVAALNPGILVEAECVMVDPGASTDPEVNLNVREINGRGGEPHYFTGGLTWSTFGGSSTWWDSSWQGGGTIRQPGISFTCNGTVQTPWIGELQILSHPWT